jgi:hypothetical protein
MNKNMARSRQVFAHAPLLKAHNPKRTISRSATRIIASIFFLLLHPKVIQLITHHHLNSHNETR